MGSKYDNRTTAIKIKNVHNDVHISITYNNDEPWMVTFSHWKKDTDDDGNSIGEERNHRVILASEDIEALRVLFKENELI